MLGPKCANFSLIEYGSGLGFVSIALASQVYVSIRQHTSAYVSTRQHTSAYVSIALASQLYSRGTPADVC